MNIFKSLVRGSIATLVSLLSFAVLAAPHAFAIPYTGDTTQASPVPAFNVFTGNVPQQGDESDFLRGKVLGDTADSVNDVTSTCETGKRFQLRVYVHNGASQYHNDNGTGASIAHDSKVKITLPAGDVTSFSPLATLSASNAASASDTMNIHCSDGKIVKVHYVTGTAQQLNTNSGAVNPLSDSIVTTGAAIGTNGPDGNMWGCWDSRILVRLVVEVSETPKPTPSSAICYVDDKAFIVENRKVKVTVDAKLDNATKTGKYEINWGDNSAVSTSQTDTHTYDKDGTYTITARVQVKLADGTVKWVDGDGCTKKVTFKNKVPMCTIPGKENLPADSPNCKTVTVPPTTVLPNTGAGDVFGIFGGVSAFGAGVHQLVTRRRIRKS